MYFLKQHVQLTQDIITSFKIRQEKNIYFLRKFLRGRLYVFLFRESGNWQGRAKFRFRVI